MIHEKCSKDLENHPLIHHSIRLGASKSGVALALKFFGVAKKVLGVGDKREIFNFSENIFAASNNIQ